MGAIQPRLLLAIRPFAGRETKFGGDYVESSEEGFVLVVRGWTIKCCTFGLSCSVESLAESFSIVVLQAELFEGLLGAIAELPIGRRLAAEEGGYS